MNTNLKRAVHLLIAVGVALSLSACHSDKPSESEAKAALEQSFANCQYIKLDSFEKVNGTQQGDNGYSVDIKYTLKLQEPTDEFGDKMKQEADVLKDYQPLKQQEDALAAKVQQEEIAYVNTHPDDHRELKDMMADNPDEQAEEELRKKVFALNDQIAGLENQGLRPWQNTVAASCGAIGNSGLHALLFQKLDDLLDGTKADMTGSIQMVNTDNGWMLAQ